MSRLSRRLLLAACATLVSAGVAEVAVRLLVRGREAALFDGRREILDEPTVMEPDPTRGWRNLPGEHRFRYRRGGAQSLDTPGEAGAVEVLVTVDGEGHRGLGLPIDPGLAEIGPGEPASGERPELAVIGGSFTFGWAVADDQHFAARLARAFPEYRVVNLGVGGYGTYQSLLALEERYADRPPPIAVVHGFASFHAGRNVADPAWRYLLYRFGARGYTRVPFVSVRDNQLVRHLPEPVLPYLGALHWSTLCTQLMLYREMRAFAALGTDPLDATVRILGDMKGWATARRAPLIVVYLDQEQRPVYTAALKRNRIPYVLAPEITSLPYDQHPNPDYHAEVARLLEPVIRAAIGD